MVNEAISKLVTYALRTGLIDQCETVWVANAILEVLKLDSYADPGKEWSDIDLPIVGGSILAHDHFPRRAVYLRHGEGPRRDVLHASRLSRMWRWAS